MHTYISLQHNDNPAHSIYIKPKLKPALVLAYPGSAEYESLSQHITSVFKKTYHADVCVGYPLLMGFTDTQGNPLASLGVRCAAEESPLFLERYLDQPAESCLEDITGKHIARAAIAEAGNLASSGGNDILWLLYGLACHLDREGVEYILFTGTALLKRYLNSLNLHPHVLAMADPLRLGKDAARWGTYYATHPRVMTGSVVDFRTGLEHYFRNFARKAWK